MSISKSKVIVPLLFLLFAALLVAGVSARKLRIFSHSSQNILPRITNRTSSVRISSARRLDNGGVEITLSNQSATAIYAYTIVTSQKSIEKGMTTFLIDAPIAPGANKVERLVAGNLDSALGGDAGEDEIVVSAVYFEGGTLEGDLRHSDKLRQTIAGMKEQAKLTLRILRDACASNEQDSGRLLDAVESEAASMTVSDGFDTASRAHQLGRTNIRARFTNELKQLKITRGKSVTEIRTHLAKLVPYYQQLAEKL